MKTILSLLSRCYVWGTLISGLLSYLSAEEEADATREENKQSKEWTERLNKIKLQQYEREQRFKESKFDYEQKQDRIKQWEGMVNSNMGLRDRLSRIWR